MPIRYLVYHSGNEGLIRAWIKNSIPEREGGVIGAVRSSEQGHGRTPRPKMFGAGFAKATQGAAAKVAGELVRQRGWMPASLHQMVRAGMEARWQKRPRQRRPSILGVRPRAEAGLAPFRSWA